MKRQQWFVWLFVGMIVMLTLSPMLVGSARADSSLPISQGGFLTNDREFLVFNGYVSWGGVYNTITNNSQVYASTFDVVIYSLISYSRAITIELTESGTSYNQSTTVQPGVADVVSVNLIPDNSWTEVKLTVDFTNQYYSVAVPISFLPNSITTVGGLDLIALGIISECLVALSLSIAGAYAAMRKAIWAPKFSLLIWGHVILIGIASAVILDFQEVDQLFAGWSPLVYAFMLAPIFFFFSLSYFNKAPKAELLQTNAPLAGRLSFNRWTLRIARDRKGKWSIIGPKWRDFFARLVGHGVPLTAQESSITAPEPFIADIINRRVKSRSDIFRRVRRPSPDKSNPLDDFDVIPAAVDGRAATGRDDPPVKLMFTPTGHPVDVMWPKLSLHKDKDVPAKTLKDGTVVPPHRERRLSLPHYTEGKATLTLHTIHYRSAMSVVSGWRTAEDLAQVLSDTMLDLEALKSSFDTQVAQKVRERGLARASLLGRGMEDMDEQEASQEAERERNTLPSLDSLFGRGLVPNDIAAKSADDARKADKKKGRR